MERGSQEKQVGAQPSAGFETNSRGICKRRRNSPDVLDKLCHGATGITLITPQTLLEWADVAMPMSADENHNCGIFSGSPRKKGNHLIVTRKPGPLWIKRNHVVCTPKSNHFDDKGCGLPPGRSNLGLCPGLEKLVVSPMQYVSTRLKSFSLLSHWGARMWAGKTKTFQTPS